MGDNLQAKPRKPGLDESLSLQSAVQELIQSRLQDGVRVHFTVTTGSMLPFLAPGDRVAVEKTEARQLIPGDVILWAALPTPIIHRVLSVDLAGSDWLIITKGDQMVKEDPVMSSASVLGIARQVERAGKVLDMTAKFVQVVNGCLARCSGLHAAFLRKPGMVRRMAGRGVRQVMILLTWITWRAARLIL